MYAQHKKKKNHGVAKNGPGGKRDLLFLDPDVGFGN